MTPLFARVLPSKPLVQESLAIEIGATMVRVQAGFDAELLRSVVAALSDEK